MFRPARLTDLLAAYGADACQDLVLIPFKTNPGGQRSDHRGVQPHRPAGLPHPDQCGLLRPSGHRRCRRTEICRERRALAVLQRRWRKSPDQHAGRHHPVEHRVRHHHAGRDAGGAGQHRHPAGHRPAHGGSGPGPYGQRGGPAGGTRGKAERTAFTQAALAAWVQNKEYIKNTSEREEG